MAGFFDSTSNPFEFSIFSEDPRERDIAQRQQMALTQQQAMESVAPQQPSFAPGPTGNPMLNPAMGNPTLPPGHPMGGQPMGGTPQGQPFNANQFLSSPGMAMTSQAINNISALRRGQVPQQTPVTAFQRAAAQGQQLLHQKAKLLDARKLNSLRARSLERGFDPAADYKSLVSQGLIDANEMPFIDFQRLASTSSDPSDVRSYQFYSSLNPQQKAEFLEVKRANQMIALGGGAEGRVGPGGTLTPVTGGGSVEDFRGEFADAEGTLEQTKKRFVNYEQADNEFRAAAGTLPDLETALSDTIALKDAIQSGEFQKTGFFEGRIFRFTDEKTAKLAAKQVLQTLKNLDITNLAPVTENEIRLIEDLYASVLKDPAANIGALDAAVEMMQSKIASINAMGEYYVANGDTLAGYGIKNRWGKTPASSPAPGPQPDAIDLDDDLIPPGGN